MDILEQLIVNGFAKKDFTLLKGKLKFTIKTLSGKEQLSIEDWMKDIKGTPAFIVHNFTLRMLTVGLLSYQDTTLKGQNPEQIFGFVEQLDTTILDRLTASQKDFYAECNKLANLDEIENLSPAPSVDSDSK